MQPITTSEVVLRSLPRRNVSSRRADLPPLPDCGNTCVNTQSTLDSQRPGGCGSTDTVCQCGSVTYGQPVYDCFARMCNHTDLVASYNFVDAICASVGTTVSPGLNTQDPRLASSSASVTSASTSSISTSLSNSASNELTASSIPSANPSPSLSNIPSPIHSFSTSTGATNALPSSDQPSLGQTTSPTPNTVAIAGGSVAGIAVLALLLFGIWLYRRQKQSQGSSSSIVLTEPSPYKNVITERGQASPSMTKQPRTITPAFEQPYRIPEHVAGFAENDNERPQRPASTILTETTDFPPPAYQPPPASRRVASTLSPGTQNSFASYPESVDGPETAFPNDEIYQFCTANRSLISPALESKLRAAHWLPTDDPNEMPVDRWRTTYGIEIFELKRIQEAFNRSNGSG